MLILEAPQGAAVDGHTWTNQAQVMRFYHSYNDL
jgi:hypothetical protein